MTEDRYEVRKVSEPQTGWIINPVPTGQPGDGDLSKCFWMAKQLAGWRESNDGKHLGSLVKDAFALAYVVIGGGLSVAALAKMAGLL